VKAVPFPDLAVLAIAPEKPLFQLSPEYLIAAEKTKMLITMLLYKNYL
jgi:hypothetical protein